MIAFKSLDRYRIIENFTQAKTDSIVITISFEDGDGDLGTNSTDTSIQNYYIALLKRKSGIYNEVTLLTPGKRFPRLAPDDDYLGPLEGTLSLNAKLTHGFDINNPGTPDGLQYGDTIKFNVSIKDRADHMSNQIETSTLILAP